MNDDQIRRAGAWAIESLKDALQTTITDSQQRADITGLFCNEWNRRIAAAPAAPVDEARLKRLTDIAERAIEHALETAGVLSSLGGTLSVNAGVEMFEHGARAQLVASETGPVCVPEVLLTALRFYARGEHYMVDEDDFDSVSGEPPNWQCHHEDTTMFENGTVARLALRGIAGNWVDGGEDDTPAPIDGEVFAPTAPADKFAERPAVIVKFAPVMKAVVNLLAAVDEKHEKGSVPLKFTIPYGEVNALRAAVDMVAADISPQTETIGSGSALRRTAEDRLDRLAIGSCNCLTKTPEAKFHREDCRYRWICECADAVRDLATLATPTAQSKPQEDNHG